MRYTRKENSLDVPYNAPRATAYGALAGAIGAWAISGVLLLVELTMGFQQGLFYSVIGLAISGSTSVTFVGAQYIGLLLHVLTGTLVGTIGGFTMAVCPLFRIYNIRKSLVMGVVIGLTAWVLIFLPISIGIVIPSMDKVLVPLGSNLPLYTFANQIAGIIWLVIAGSIIFHVFYGLVFGLMMSILIPYKSKSYRCVNCQSKFTSMADMSKHINENHKWFLCETCNTEFMGEISYLRHKEGCS